MRVAVLSPVWFPVPPDAYGGIEWIVSLLADGLVDAGHDVTLFASGDSRTKAHLSSVYGVAPGSMGPTPFAHTVHGPLSGHPGRLYEQITAMVPHAALIAVSDDQRRPMPELPWVATCPNALDLSMYPFAPERGDYLLFLGRMTADKGAHRAIAVAMESGLPLKLAGKCREPLEQRYFDELVRPHLSERIQYVGEVTHGEKVELLQHARATLFPIEWDEPFGLVMIESMACGTPVIATRYGAVPEVIEDGVSGVIVDRWRDMPDALERADAIDPRVQRDAVEERFSPERMVVDYVAAYEATIERWAAPASSR